MTDTPQMNTNFSVRESFPSQWTILFDCARVRALHYQQFGRVNEAPEYSSNTFRLVLDSRYNFDEVLTHMRDREMGFRIQNLAKDVDSVVKAARDMGIKIDTSEETE